MNIIKPALNCDGFLASAKLFTALHSDLNIAVMCTVWCSHS